MNDCVPPILSIHSLNCVLYNDSSWTMKLKDVAEPEILPFLTSHVLEAAIVALIC